MPTSAGNPNVEIPTEPQKDVDILNLSIRTTTTKTITNVISDFAVVAPYDDSLQLDAADILARCCAIRDAYVRNADGPLGPPEEFPRRFRADTSDDDKSVTSHGTDEYQPTDSSRATTLPALGVQLRKRSSGDRSDLHLSDLGPIARPAPRRSNTPQSSDGSEPLEPLDWVDEMISKNTWKKDRRRDEVCNVSAAFRAFRDFGKLVVAILGEGKHAASRQGDHPDYHDATFDNFHEAMRALISQATYLLTSDTWSHQDSVVVLAMVGDYWSWGSFRRIQDRENNPKLHWEEYTTSNAPIEQVEPWTEPVQWGTPASSEALQEMMACVNRLFPRSTTTSVTKPAAAASQATPDVDATPVGTTAPCVPTAPVHTASSAGSSPEPQAPFTDNYDDELEYADDGPDASTPVPGAPPRARHDREANVVDGTLRAGVGPTPLAVPPPMPSMPVNVSRRRHIVCQDTLDLDHGGSVVVAAQMTDNGDDDHIRGQPLHRANTDALVHAMAGVHLQSDVDNSAQASGPIDSTHSSEAAIFNSSLVNPTPVNPPPVNPPSANPGIVVTNPRKRSASPDSDMDAESGDEPAPKKVKQATAPGRSAADAGPSSQAPAGLAQQGQPRRESVKTEYDAAHPRGKKGKFVPKKR
ncbi:hypothetical protein HDZ31DRAFT_64046 [Schizophyllum fasciatum]